MPPTPAQPPQEPPSPARGTPTQPPPTDPREVDRAAQALRAGQLAVLPTETVYGVFARADLPAPMARLRAARDAAGGGGAPANAPFTWHAASADEVIASLAINAPVHQHILKTLWPGPVRILLERDASDLAPALARLGLPVGVIDAPAEASAPADTPKRVVSVRVPDEDVARDVLRQAGGPVVAERATLLHLGDGVTLGPGVAAAAQAAGVEAWIDRGKVRLGQPSTTLRLTREGWYRVEGVGALSERVLRARIETGVLFVCTGNTCRSPMAEAVALHLLSKPGSTRVPTRVQSAGVSASDSDPMTPEAREALALLGVETSTHRSQGVTRAMIEDASVIYAMTQGHLRRLVELVPGAAGKVQLLDPAGRDVPDPLGGSLADYRASAERIFQLVRQRLAELGLIVPQRKRGALEPPDAPLRPTVS